MVRDAAERIGARRHIPPSEQAELLREFGRSLGIGIESILEPTVFADVVASAGLVAEIFTPDDMNNRYLRARTDGMRPTIEWLAVAHR